MGLKQLDNVVGATSYTVPGILYVGLFSATPGVGTPANEITNGNSPGYARKSVTNNTTNFPASTVVSGVATKKNGTDITFAAASGTWVTVTYAGIFDASSGGELLFFGPLATARSFINGDVPKILANSLTLTAI